MDKNEILKLSREQKEDEGVIQAENKGRYYGFKAFGAMTILIILFNLFTGQNIFVPTSLFWAFLAADAYGKYKVFPNRLLLITTVGGGISAILAFIAHVVSVLRP